MTLPDQTMVNTTEMEVHNAISAFVQTLAESAEFQTFEEAAERLYHDEVAQRSLQVFQAKEQSLQMMAMLNAVDPADTAELEQLHQALMAEPAVIAYLQVQAEMAALCQGAADLISQRIGLNFAAARRSGCCG